jgi:hypothetical protein
MTNDVFLIVMLSVEGQNVIVLSVIWAKSLGATEEHNVDRNNCSGAVFATLRFFVTC